MTLIVGFRCGDSAVLCADSQETRGNLKTEVDKLPIYAAAPSGGMGVVCGGAGSGVLTDAFRARVAAALIRSTAGNEDDIRREIEAELVAFHQSAVFTAFPASKADKLIAGLIAARSPSQEVFLFKYLGSVVQPVQTYALVGEDYAFFDRIAQRRYRRGLSINQAVLLGLEIVSEAKQTSPFVGGPTRVVIARPEGIASEDQAHVQWTEAHIVKQNELFDNLRFNLSSTDDQVEGALRSFGNSITEVRLVYGSKDLAWPTLSDSGSDDDDGSE